MPLFKCGCWKEEPIKDQERCPIHKAPFFSSSSERPHPFYQRMIYENYEKNRNVPAIWYENKEKENQELRTKLAEQTKLAKNYEAAWLQLLTLWPTMTNLLERAIKQIRSKSDFTSKEELVTDIRKFIRENNDTKKMANG